MEIFIGVICHNGNIVLLQYKNRENIKRGSRVYKGNIRTKKQFATHKG